jgi:hypothetical protein
MRRAAASAGERGHGPQSGKDANMAARAYFAAFLKNVLVLLMLGPFCHPPPANMLFGTLPMLYFLEIDTSGRLIRRQKSIRKR